MVKMKRVIVLCLFFVVGGIGEVFGDPLRYEIVGGTVTIKTCELNASGDLEIPSTYEVKTGHQHWGWCLLSLQ